MNYEQILDRLFNNPLEASKMCIGVGADRVAYQLEDGSVLKIEKVAMIPENISYDYMLSTPDSIAVHSYYSKLGLESNFYSQTELEIHTYNQLTPIEKKLFNPITKQGVYHDMYYTVSPYVQTGIDLDCDTLEDLCDRYSVNFDFHMLHDISEDFQIDYYDMVSNPYNFGLSSLGEPIILDFGLENTYLGC